MRNDRICQPTTRLSFTDVLAPDDYEVLYQLGIVLPREADIWGAIADLTKMEKRIAFYKLLMLKVD